MKQYYNIYQHMHCHTHIHYTHIHIKSLWLETYVSPISASIGSQTPSPTKSLQKLTLKLMDVSKHWYTVNMEKFTGLNVCVFHSFKVYCESISVNISTSD